MASADILRAARARIEDPKNWTQGAFARDAAGNSARVNGGVATCWCAWGALRAETRAPGSPYVESLELLREAARLEFERCGPDEVNDDLGHPAVLLMFDVAIGLAEARAAR